MKPNVERLIKELSNKAGKLAAELTKLLRARKAGVDDIFYTKDAAKLGDLQAELRDWGF